MPVSVGWNWIGYLPQQGLSVDDALASLNPLNGDIIKSQTSFAQYVAGIGWLGNLNFMSSPNGYLLNISNAGDLIYPASLVGEEEEEQFAPGLVEGRSPGNYWEVVPQQYEHSMNMVGIVIDADDLNLLQEMDEVGAFVNGEVRGSSKPIYIPAFDAYYLFLTVFANEEGEEVQFRFYDATQNEIFELEQSFIFSSNRIIGTVDIPQELTLSVISSMGEQSNTPYSFDIFPNPTSGNVYLRFSSEQQQEVSITVRDVLGRQIDFIEVHTIEGRNILEWSPREDLANGLYFFSLQQGQQLQTKALELIR
jgi:hypothetical protein